MRTACLLLSSTAAQAVEVLWPWGPQQLNFEMTRDQRIAIVVSRFGMPLGGKPKPAGALDSAGYVPGVGSAIPPLQEADGGLGLANPTNADFDATAMPSGLALAATFDPDLAARAGRAIGAEARDRGFSVLLAGGANLTREPRGGRDFEYAGEDPLLTGTIVGAEVAGIQENQIVSTVKHFALNDQETGRVVLDAKLGESAMRESDLLAFELALERGRPWAVMTAYNRINGTYASQNAALISGVLKGDWGFPGWVMSDWGGTHSTVEAANAGLDQESGADLDTQTFFGAPLAAAVADGRVTGSRLSNMVTRQLRARFALDLMNRPMQARSMVGFMGPPRPGPARDLPEHAALAKEIATRAIVLLKNDHAVIPLQRDAKRVLVVGGHADIGVLSGGGSSQVVPKGSIRFPGDPPGVFYGEPKVYHPSPPLAALRAALPQARVDFADGRDREAAARLAAQAEVVIVFADAWRNESRDVADLALPGDQDALIAKIAAANPRTIVVLETGGPVTMPWLDAVAGVIEAWYPGQRGGEAIADILTGRAAPAGRLPMTFPAAEAQLPRPRATDPATTTSNPGEPAKGAFTVDYDIEGADVGYKWFSRTGRKPLFPFGFGLSTTRFSATGLETRQAPGGGLTLAFALRNDGPRPGTEVAQAYLDGPGLTRRLVGFAPTTLAPGEAKHVTLVIDPRLLARFDPAAHGWAIAAGRYTLAVRADALADGPSVTMALGARTWPARHAAWVDSAAP